MLRRALVLYGLLALIGAFILFHVGAPLAIVAYVAVNGVAVVGGIVLERRGYHPRVHRELGAWERTDERFIDPVSGHLMEVRYNPTTGERDYVDLGPGSD
jgi:hypothetical protein